MYKEIFEEIISIMHEDYSGCIDKQGWDNPNNFREIIKNKNNSFAPNEFIELVKDYLLDFKDNHIHFKCSNQNQEPQQERGFKVRRFKDKLYVISVRNEENIALGSAISALDGVPIMELREQYSRILNENHVEREQWNPILIKHETCTIVNDDETTNVVRMEKFDKIFDTPTYTIKKMAEGPVVVTLTDFDDPDTICKLIRANEEILSTSESLIIDVRKNAGGTDASFIDLLAYIFPEEEKDYYDPAVHTMLFNCTARTCDLQLDMINEQLEKVEDEQTILMIEDFKSFFQSNHGKGFVNFNIQNNNSFIMKGKVFPKKVIILSDVFCGSSGDSFVEACKLSNKVTVVGRATAGLNDYTNLAIKKWPEGFELWYPTSKLKRVDDGKGMTRIGLEPDIYIPWTPQHIKEDLDMQMALEIIKSNPQK
ncbi:S41 family peptidase [Psychrobacillus sp. NPDC058041]|uniref:S41 family peptidase n=1 Tax=Psychrobacillus sp. NPDC058041 TaxID=3346310 RepID=UPI0036DBC72B